MMKRIYEQVEKNIDFLVEKGVGWSECATAEQMQEAREGRLKLNFYDREVPPEWICDVKGKKVLCLAGAGGLQAPLLACAGAEVTVLDLSDKMLDKDREAVKREGQECYRLLKKNGIFIMMAPNPINYICDFVNDEDGGYYKAVNKMPYCSADFEGQGDWIEYGHTMEDYIGGQISCGFLVSGYVECQLEDITELYFMTKAVKME